MILLFNGPAFPKTPWHNHLALPMWHFYYGPSNPWGLEGPNGVTIHTHLGISNISWRRTPTQTPKYTPTFSFLFMINLKKNFNHLPKEYRWLAWLVRTLGKKGGFKSLPPFLQHMYLHYTKVVIYCVIKAEYGTLKAKLPIFLSLNMPSWIFNVFFMA